MKKDDKETWKTPRGASIIFYVDFIDLIGIMTGGNGKSGNNWELFKDDFKDQSFITMRIQELYDIRNKIAHNSSLSDQEVQTIDSWSKQIYDQLIGYHDLIKNWQQNEDNVT